MCRTTVAIIDLNEVIDLVNLVTTNVVKSALMNICAGRVLERHEVSSSPPKKTRIDSLCMGDYAFNTFVCF